MYSSTDSSTTTQRSLLFITATVLILSLTSCSPTFVIRAAYEESKILLGRKNINEVVEDPTTETETKRKLKIVQNARSYAESMGLTPKDSFTAYTKVDKDVLVWVLAGSKSTSFELYNWWFPVVGNVPYKGFFDKRDAETEAENLKKLGYEVSVRGAEALSTLGWFNDPILSTTLKNQDDWIVNTVIHETVHSTVWIKNNVPFNESLANFVGFEGAVQFFTAQFFTVQSSQSSKKSKEKDWIKISTERRAMEFELAAAIEKLYADLKELYKSYAPDDVKLTWRQKIFDRHTAPIRAKYPEMKILKEINNSEIMQLKFYMTSLELFNALYISVKQDWFQFFSVIKEISDQIDNDPKLDPFELLKDKTAAIEIP